MACFAVNVAVRWRSVSMGPRPPRRTRIVGSTARGSGWPCIAAVQPSSRITKIGGFESATVSVFDLSFGISPQQSDNFFDGPDAIRNSGFHCRRYARALMHTTEVVIHEEALTVRGESR